MTAEHRPLLALGAPELGERSKQGSRVLPRLHHPSVSRQGDRLTPQFRELVDAFDNQRFSISNRSVDEIDPALVLVFDLAGSVENFCNAIDKVEGLEFLSELLDKETEPDDDFHMIDSKIGRTDKTVQHSLYLVMSNAEAVSQLVRLFEQWQADPSVKFERGLARFGKAFEQLRAIRRWSATDRIRDTGLLDAWHDRLELAGQSFSPVLVEIELWYRRDATQRLSAEARLDEVIRTAGGQVKDRAQIDQIAYHALLVELPVQQVEVVVRDGAEAIQLLLADEIMFVSPYIPMTVAPPTVSPLATLRLPAGSRVSEFPRIALFDGLPFVHHDALAGRLIVDDPDGLGENYPVLARNHGSAMASLIIHGDLSSPGKPLDRALYVRPILQPQPMTGHEQAAADKLLTDLLHRAIRRIVKGEAGQKATAPSVRVVNLSIGAGSRALIRRISPLGRLLDWLAVEYNLLFIVSAGNHTNPISIPADAARDLDTARCEALKSARSTSRLRGLLPPGDAINALTVGATHDDLAGEIDLPDTVWDITEQGMPALYGAVGPGIGRSVKPEIQHSGGRVIYNRPVVTPGAERVELGLAPTAATGPGHQVAAPGRGGATNMTAFLSGTSNATALVTREASRLFDVLERGADDAGDMPFPDAQFHPVLVKALLVHASSWGKQAQRLKQALNLNGQQARRDLTALLGYGALDLTRLGTAATNRAVLIAAGRIGRDERHTYDVPLPVSLQSKAEWHRVTVTLAYMAPTVGQLMRYRRAKVFFHEPDKTMTSGHRAEAEHNAVKRGSCQHEIFEGTAAMIFGAGDRLPIDVECMDDAQRLKGEKKIRYGLVVSVETAVETSTTIHDEVRTQLRAQARAQARPRVTS